MLEVPPLSEDGLRVLAICAHIDRLPDAPPIGPDEITIAKLAGGGDESLVRRIIDSQDDYCHFHIEAGLESVMPPFGEPGTPADILELPAAIAGTQQLISAWARFRLNRAAAPDNGLLRTVSAMDVPPRGGYRMSITGCTLNPGLFIPICVSGQKHCVIPGVS